MTSRKSVGFIFFALALLPFVASSQTFPKISFSAPIDTGITARIFAPAAIGDVNNDGNTDIVHDGHLYLGDGSGHFTLSPIDESAISGPYATYAALGFHDLNGDGKLDYVRIDPSFDTVGECPLAPLLITVLLGDGMGHFTPSQVISRGGTVEVAAAYGDYDGDGKMDFALYTGETMCIPDTATVTTREVTTYLNNGGGTFRAKTTVLPLALIRDQMVAGDFNGDGKMDLGFTGWTVNSSSQQVWNLTTLLGFGDGTFKAGTNYTLDSEYLGFSAGDMNGDGRTDLVVSLEAKSTPGAQPRIATLMAQANGTFRWQSAVSVATLPGFNAYIARSQHAVDLNGDGKLDFFVPTTQSLTSPKMDVIAVMSGNGTGNLSTAQRLPPTGTMAYQVMIPLTVGAPPSILYANTTEGGKMWIVKNLSH